MGEDSLLQPNPLLTTSPHELVPYLELNLLDENRNPDLSSFTSMRIFATHMPYLQLPKSITDSKCKIVYLCRNLKGNKKMWPKEIGEISLEVKFNKFCSGRVPVWALLGSRLGVLDGRLGIAGVLFLEYKDMKERPVEMVKRLAVFIGCPIIEVEEANEILRMCGFESLHTLEVNKKGKSPLGGGEQILFQEKLGGGLEKPVKPRNGGSTRSHHQGEARWIWAEALKFSEQRQNPFPVW